MARDEEAGEGDAKDGFARRRQEADRAHAEAVARQEEEVRHREEAAARQRREAAAAVRAAAAQAAGATAVPVPRAREAEVQRAREVEEAEEAAAEEEEEEEEEEEGEFARDGLARPPREATQAWKEPTSTVPIIGVHQDVPQPSSEGQQRSDESDTAEELEGEVAPTLTDYMGALCPLGGELDGSRAGDTELGAAAHSGTHMPIEAEAAVSKAGAAGAMPTEEEEAAPALRASKVDGDSELACSSSRVMDSEAKLQGTPVGDSETGNPGLSSSSKPKVVNEKPFVSEEALAAPTSEIGLGAPRYASSWREHEACVKRTDSAHPSFTAPLTAAQAMAKRNEL